MCGAWVFAGIICYEACVISALDRVYIVQFQGGKGIFQGNVACAARQKFTASSEPVHFKRWGSSNDTGEGYVTARQHF